MDVPASNKRNNTALSTAIEDIPDRRETLSNNCATDYEMGLSSTEMDDGGSSSNEENETTRENENSSLQKCSRKRKYEMVHRTPNPRGVSDMRKRWCAIVESQSSQKIKRTSCCSRLKCFREVNVDFLTSRQVVILGSSKSGRRELLESLIGSGGRYIFDGRQVCMKFLQKAFRFSRDMITEVRRCTSSNVDVVPQMQSNTAHIHSDRPASKRESIVTFLQRIAEDTANQMPDCSEQHLPFFTKCEVYKLFTSEHERLHAGLPPRMDYFYHVWKKTCPNIKVRKVARFSKCVTCEQIRNAQQMGLMKGEDISKFKQLKSEHLLHIGRERVQYKMKRERAILHPNKFLSIIIDGADQTAFGLPHFVVNTKESRGHALKVKMVGLIEHCRPNKLHLFTMTEEHETGANHIVETLHRYLTMRKAFSTIPRILYLQLDNCSRENKNRYLLGYVECLLRWNIFDEIEVGFLPVGHTHEDIDQAFSCTAERLRSCDAVTLEDLHEEVRKAYNAYTTVTHMRNIVNWSGLCESQHCLTRIANFTQYQYFRFSRSAESNQSDLCIEATLQVKKCSADNWLKPSVSTFKISTPDIKLSPPTVVKSSPNKKDVLKRIDSEESWINNVQKSNRLRILTEFVFQDRTDPFHRDVEKCFERATDNENNSIEEAVNGDSSEPDEEQNNTFYDEEEWPNEVESSEQLETRQNMYSINSFVVVRSPNNHASCPFWVGKVVDTKISRDGRVSALTVHWYDVGKKKDVWEGSYYPCFITEKSPHSNISKRCSGKGSRSSACKTPWKDVIDAESVIIVFANLTVKKTIPIIVRRKIK